MKRAFSSNIAFIILLFLGGSLVGTLRYFGAKDDNPIEEAIEQVIKDKTGIDIDLTPETPEQKESQYAEGAQE